MRIRKPLSILALLIILISTAACGAAQTAVPSTPVPTATSVPTLAEPTATVDLPTATTAAPTSQTTDAGAIQFAANTTSWYTQGDLDPNTAIRFHLSAQEGQQMNLWLTTEPASGDPPQATLFVSDAAGQPLTLAPTTYWSQVLPAGQEYSIEVRSLAQANVQYTLQVEIPAAVIDPALGNQYEPISADVCKQLQETMAAALGQDVVMAGPAPFLDSLAGEAGQGCRLSAAGTGADFDSPQDVVTTLVGSVGLGWTDQAAYRADGPSGSAAGLARDMALMLIDAQWTPAMGVECPADQPIGDCPLTPEQKVYTIRVDVAQYKASFSLDGHWVDAATGFTLDLFQEWKNIGGGHSIVADGGNKIDALDNSISGVIQGQGALVQFQSSFSAATGAAQITVIDPNTISWKIITPPDGEYYLPAEATLTR